MLRFYDLWRRGRMDPAEALRRAQIGFRTTTNGEKHDYAAQLTAASRANGDSPRACILLAAAYRGSSHEERDAAAPRHWAGFAHFGPSPTLGPARRRPADRIEVLARREDFGGLGAAY